MKNVFIISAIKIYDGNSAGAARMMNIARALALSNVYVFLCSSSERWKDKSELQQIESNIFCAIHKKDLIRPWYHRFTRFFISLNYLVAVRRFAKTLQGIRIFYLYPTTEASMDFAVLMFLKLFCRERIFYDMNELRRAGLRNVTFSKNKLKMFYQRLVWSLQFVGFWLVELCTVFYDGLVVISMALEKYFYRYNKNLLRVPILSKIPAAIPAPPAFKKGETFRLCFAGQIALKKEGFDTFYEALSLLKKSYSNFELHLYGSISNNEKEELLIRLPREMNIENNILYHGIIAQRELLKELQKHHLLLLPRPWNLQTHYGFSTKLSEYLVSGIPTLVTTVSDNALYIEDGKNGFLVKPGDAQALADKLLLIILDYKRYNISVPRCAYKTAKENFDYSSYSKSLLKVFFR